MSQPDDTSSLSDDVFEDSETTARRQHSQSHNRCPANDAFAMRELYANNTTPATGINNTSATTTTAATTIATQMATTNISAQALPINTASKQAKIQAAHLQQQLPTGITGSSAIIGSSSSAATGNFYTANNATMQQHTRATCSSNAMVPMAPVAPPLTSSHGAYRASRDALHLYAYDEDLMYSGETFEDGWKSYHYDELDLHPLQQHHHHNMQPFDDTVNHKTILLGDSGVGKTSFLVKYNTGDFRLGSFSATVGIALTVIMLGDSGVGKTSVMLRYGNNIYQTQGLLTTVGIDFMNKVVFVDGTKVKLQIWDTAGQERFKSVTHAYYRDAHALLLLYDVTNKITFDNIRAWLGEIREYAQDDVVIVLLGNKADASNSERQVKKEDGERLAAEYNVPFMETSAKTGLNVELSFAAVARQLKSRGYENGRDGRFNVHDFVRDNTQTRSMCAQCKNM